MTPAEIDALRAEHPWEYEPPQEGPDEGPWCGKCRVSWPCPVTRLCDALEAAWCENERTAHLYYNANNRAIRATREMNDWRGWWNDSRADEKAAMDETLRQRERAQRAEAERDEARKDRNRQLARCNDLLRRIIDTEAERDRLRESREGYIRMARMREDEANHLRTELEATQRELERWRHGKQVEGDYVCPDSVELVAAREQLRLANVDQANAEAEANELRTELEAARTVVEAAQILVEFIREWELRKATLFHPLATDRLAARIRAYDAAAKGAGS